MRSLVSLISFVATGGAVISQTLGDAYWDRIVVRADSVVISRFGTDFFINHIFTPEYSLDYIVDGEYSYDWEDRGTITRPPTSCHFEYDIGFDSLNSGRMNIMLNITPGGKVLEDEDLRGFISGPVPVAFYTDLPGFIELAKRNGVKCKPKEAFRVLRWVPLDTAARIHPHGEGSYELTLGKARGTRSEKVANSVHTFRIVDSIVFDPFSGAILRKEERFETISWACGVGNL